MNEQQERSTFQARFSPQSKEVLVLTQEHGGAGRAGTNILWEMNFPLLAVIDLESGQLLTEPCHLCWQLTDAECHTKGYIFDLQDLTIYHLRVHESLSTQYFPQGRFLWLTEVLERNCQDARLNELLTAYQIPVVLEVPGCSTLTLDKSLDSFYGEGKWAGKDCQICLDTDAPQAQTADNALPTLQTLLSDALVWDQKARQFAANALIEAAIDWQDESDDENPDLPEITKDEFAARITISEISVHGDEFELYYDDDDIFWGHIIIVSGDLTDGFSDATIAG